MIKQLRLDGYNRNPLKKKKERKKERERKTFQSFLVVECEDKIVYNCKVRKLFSCFILLFQQKYYKYSYGRDKITENILSGIFFSGIFSGTVLINE